MGATDLHNTLIMVILKIGPSGHFQCSIPKIIYSMLMNNSVIVRRTKVKMSNKCSLAIYVLMQNFLM